MSCIDSDNLLRELCREVADKAKGALRHLDS